MSKERWKPVNGYEGYYEVSNMGRVRRRTRKRPNGRRMIARLLKPTLKPPRVALRDRYGVVRKFELKTLIANHWLTPRTGAPVHFIDETNYDCAVSNLRENAPKTQKSLSKSQITRIKFESSTGVSNREIAEKYNVSDSLISQILSEES